jgi:hypothetical protein
MLGIDGEFMVKHYQKPARINETMLTCSSKRQLGVGTLIFSNLLIYLEGLFPHGKKMIFTHANRRLMLANLQSMEYAAIAETPKHYQKTDNA